MARLKDDAQWIILLGLIISVSIFFLALIINESVLVGQTTAESVLELPKSDIQDFRNEVFRSLEVTNGPGTWEADIINISMKRKNAVVNISVPSDWLNPQLNEKEEVSLHFDNGVTNYDEDFNFTKIQ